MDALFHGLSVVTVSWLVACPQALVHGGLGVWAQPAAILLQTGIWGSPGTWLVDGAEWNTFMGTAGGSWSWILVCGCRRSSGCQLHLDWVVVTDCQGLEEGKRWEMFSEPLTPRSAAGAHRAVPCPARTFCLLEGAHCPQPQDTRHTRLSWKGAQVWLGWALAGCPLPSKPPCLIWGLCANDGLLKVGFGLSPAHRRQYKTLPTLYISSLPNGDRQ